MNVLFLTLVRIASLEERGIYQDLLRKFRDEGHTVCVVSPLERRLKLKTELVTREGTKLLQVKTFNIQKTNIIEKGLGTLAIEIQYLNAIKRYLKDIKFDLILYSTPPITFTRIIDYIKTRDKAYSYLLLKDIFPQNAVDMGLLKKNSTLHNFFTKKERRLYDISDTIGCMSKANVNYLKLHNRTINTRKIEVNPNSIEPKFISYTSEEKNSIRKKYNIPIDKKILVYGGNLGKPQGLDFLLELLETHTQQEFHFLIVGDGTEYSRIEKWFRQNNISFATLLKKLPKEDYDKLLGACDIGLIFLHPAFKIPNFPSRLLSYLEMKIPVISVTDAITDIGDIVEEANCGYKVLSGDIQTFNNCLLKLNDETTLTNLGSNSWKLLMSNYKVDRSYNLILDKL